MIERGTEEEKYLREKHLENNTFGDGDADTEDDGMSGWARRGSDTGDGGRGCFIEGEEVRVVVVRIRDGRVADWKGAVRDWSLGAPEASGERLVNGV